MTSILIVINDISVWLFCDGELSYLVLLFIVGLNLTVFTGLGSSSIVTTVMLFPWANQYNLLWTHFYPL